MLLSVLLAFFICWTPFQSLQLYNATRSLDEAVSSRDFVNVCKLNNCSRAKKLFISSSSFQYPDILDLINDIALYLAYGNSALNPILYAGLNDAFRAAFKETLGFGRSKRVFPGTYICKFNQIQTLDTKKTGHYTIHYSLHFPYSRFSYFRKLDELDILD